MSNYLKMIKKWMIYKQRSVVYIVSRAIKKGRTKPAKNTVAVKEVFTCD